MFIIKWEPMDEDGNALGCDTDWPSCIIGFIVGLLIGIFISAVYFA